MGGQDEQIFPILDHAYCQTWREGLCGLVAVEKNYIAVPYPHKYYYVSVEYLQEQCHGTSWFYWARTDLGWLETDLCAKNLDILPERLGDIHASDSRPLPIFEYCRQCHAAAGAVLSYMCNMSTDWLQRTHPGETSIFLPN